MTLPLSFLQHVEQHPCFSGCYGSASGVKVCLDPNKPLVNLLVVSCKDCFANFAIPTSLLPAGVDSTQLASQVTLHLRGKRGFSQSVSGYFTTGPGFWFSAVFYPCGLFLINGERSRPRGSDLDQLLLAFQHGLLTPLDPRMLDARQYNVSIVYANFAGAVTVPANKADLLSLPQVRTQPVSGWQKLTLAEFIPLANSPKPAVAKPTAANTPPPKRAPLKEGDICPVCGHEVRKRQLLSSTFIGCLC
jgi:hypothetical protein